MRDFRDSKAMAHALRDALKAKAVITTHSECLELIAKAFGYENWNILSAKIDASARAQPVEPQTLHCSFCGRSQHDVRKLIAGPAVFICGECAVLCADVADDPDDADLARLLQGDADSGRTMSTDDLAHYAERGRKGVERTRLTLQSIEQALAMQDGEAPGSDDLVASRRFAYLKNMTPEALLRVQQMAQHRLKRYEDALRVARTAFSARR